MSIKLNKNGNLVISFVNNRTPKFILDEVLKSTLSDFGIEYSKIRSKMINLGWIFEDREYEVFVKKLNIEKIVEKLGGERILQMISKISSPELLKSLG